MTSCALFGGWYLDSWCKKKIQMTLRYCFHMLSLLLECTHTICFKHIHLRSAKCNLPSKPLPFLVCCSRIITAYISRCFMCDRYVCPFTIVYLLLAHLFSLRICLPSHSFTSWQKTHQFFCSMKTLKLLSFILLPTGKEQEQLEPLRSNRTSKVWIDFYWDWGLNLITKWLKSDEIGGIKENDLDNDKVVVYIGMFTFVDVLCWLSDFFFIPRFFFSETWRRNTRRNLKELMTHLRTVHLYCILEPLRLDHGGSKGWNNSQIWTTFSIFGWSMGVLIYIYICIYTYT